MLNRGEAAVGEAGGEPVMALYYEEKERYEDAMEQTEGSGEKKGWGGHQLVVVVWRYMSICSMRLLVMPNKTQGNNRIRKETADYNYNYYCDIVDVPESECATRRTSLRDGKETNSDHKNNK